MKEENGHWDVRVSCNDKYVLDNFAQPLTDVFQLALKTAGEQANNAEAIVIVYQSLGLIAKIFYSLNYQDLAKFFEDNIKMCEWRPFTKRGTHVESVTEEQRERSR